MKPFRVIDTGIREGARNIAFDAALIELRNEGRIPDTIRFLQFVPTALVGRHQDLSRELRLDYCAQNGIGLARRITGGGAPLPRAPRSPAPATRRGSATTLRGPACGTSTRSG